jgi:hypothetical protein
MVDEFNWCLCSIVGEEVVGAAEVILIGDPIDSVFYSCRKIVGVSGLYQDVKVWIVGELNVYGQRGVC